VADVAVGEGEDGLPEVAVEVPGDELLQTAVATVTPPRKAATPAPRSQRLTVWRLADVFGSSAGIQPDYRFVRFATAQ
jgi:hypothetical protein